MQIERELKIEVPVNNIDVDTSDKLSIPSGQGEMFMSDPSDSKNNIRNI
jgi:hypothetical protein